MDNKIPGNLITAIALPLVSYVLIFLTEVGVPILSSLGVIGLLLMVVFYLMFPLMGICLSVGSIIGNEQHKLLSYIALAINVSPFIFVAAAYIFKISLGQVSILLCIIGIAVLIFLVGASMLSIKRFGVSKFLKYVAPVFYIIVFFSGLTYLILQLVPDGH